ncbi:hypothetical protein [Paenibacillus sp. FJAT-27812]|uniref:hypothetical protein n=1 Tax=Paenibacillus sp. FJAT-27812 TaxID=1684143 RepID=UPI0018D0B963|nr:hypothetical protein [Paenibacillus sp. FJAT-27812]
MNQPILLHFLQRSAVLMQHLQQLVAVVRCNQSQQKKAKPLQRTFALKGFGF